MESGNENTRSLLLELPAATDSVGVARHALHGLAETLPSPVFEDLRLLVSELLTNSIRHTGLGKTDLIQLQVTRTPDIVRVEVTDNGPGFSKESSEPLSERESGWGLFLVEQISNRWGLSVDHETKVWFELDIASDGRGGAST